MEKTKFPLRIKSSMAVLITPAVVFGAVLGLVKESNATIPSISCNTETNTPNIVASFTQGDKYTETVMLQFLPQYFSTDDAVTKCQNTATALQKLYSNDEMQYLASDTLDESPVVCAVARRGNGCDNYNAQILFAVDRQANPTQVLYNMLGEDFKESELPVPRTVSRIYTDLKPHWWPFQ